MIYRHSPIEWSGSTPVAAIGPVIAVAASSNDTLCFLRFERAFLGSHSNFMTHYTILPPNVPIAPIGKKASRLQICYGDLNLLARRNRRNKKLLNEKLSDPKGPLKGIVRQISIIPKSLLIPNLCITLPCPFSVLDQSTLSQTSTDTISTSPVRIGGVLIEYRFPENS